MPRIWMMILFLSVFVLLMGGVHYYLYRRLRRFVTFRSRRQGRWVLWGLLLLGVSYPLARGLMHLFDCLPTEAFFLLASVWLGVMFYWLLFTSLSQFAFFVAGRLLPARREAVFRLERWFFFGGAALSLVLAPLGIWRAAGVPAVTRVEIASPHLPPALDGYRLVQLSDVHLGVVMDGERLQAVVDRVNQLDPDLVVITGDLVDQDAMEFGKVRGPLASLQAPGGVYAVTGNHEFYSDHRAVIRLAEEAGVHYLRNRLVRLDNGLLLYGIDDPTAERFGEAPPSIDQIIGDEALENFAILLYHQPRHFEVFAAQGIDLMLSGHTHKGQLLPASWIVPLIFPRDQGLFQTGNSALYVSAGVGTWGPPMRIGADPEIVEITLRVDPPD